MCVWREGGGTYFPKAKHSSLTSDSLAAGTISGKWTSILGSYSPMTPARHERKGIMMRIKKGGKEVVRRFRIGDKTKRETTPRCRWKEESGKKHTEGDSLNIQVTRRGDGGGCFTCGDDFIYGRIYIHISLSLTVSRQRAALAADISVIIIWFYASSSIRAGRSQTMWLIREKKLNLVQPLSWGFWCVAFRCLESSILSATQNKETKQQKNVLPLGWKHRHTIQRERFCHFCRRRLNTGVVVLLSVFCNYHAAQLSSGTKRLTF